MHVPRACTRAHTYASTVLLSDACTNRCRDVAEFAPQATCRASSVSCRTNSSAHLHALTTIPHTKTKQGKTLALPLLYTIIHRLRAACGRSRRALRLLIQDVLPLGRHADLAVVLQVIWRGLQPQRLPRLCRQARVFGNAVGCCVSSHENDGSIVPLH